jgi:hypothetical protein
VPLPSSAGRQRDICQCMRPLTLQCWNLAITLQACRSLLSTVFELLNFSDPDFLISELQDYIFPEEAGAAPNLKLLEAAQRWKQAQATAALANGS